MFCFFLVIPCLLLEKCGLTYKHASWVNSLDEGAATADHVTAFLFNRILSWSGMWFFFSVAWVNKHLFVMLTNTHLLLALFFQTATCAWGYMVRTIRTVWSRPSTRSALITEVTSCLCLNHVGFVWREAYLTPVLKGPTPRNEHVRSSILIFRKK